MPSGRQSTITDAPNAWVPALNPSASKAGSAGARSCRIRIRHLFGKSRDDGLGCDL